MCFGKTQLASGFSHLATFFSPFLTRLGAVLFCFSGFVFSLTGLHGVLSVPETQNCNHCVVYYFSFCLLTRFTCHMFGEFLNSPSCYTLYYQLSRPQWHTPGHTKTELNCPHSISQHIVHWQCLCIWYTIIKWFPWENNTKYKQQVFSCVNESGKIVSSP